MSKNTLSEPQPDSASYQPSLKVELSPSLFSHVAPFSLSLVEERGQVLQMETDQLAFEACWMNTSCGGFTPFQE